MKKFIFLFILISVPCGAQEAISLTTPIAAKPAISNYIPGELHINLPAATIEVILIATDGSKIRFQYPCALPCSFNTSAQVTGLINTLNTVNLTTRSLWRRIFDRLLIDFPNSFVGGATVQ